MKITERELEARKNRIIHRAFGLFCQKGIDQVSMEEIAKAADVSVISVYRYFSTKSELLLITQEMLWKEALQNVTSYVITADGYSRKSGFEQIRDLINGFEKLYRLHGEYLLFSAYYKLYLAREGLQLSGQKLGEMLAPIRAVFLKALEKGEKDRSLTLPCDLESTFYCLWGTLWGYVEEIVVYDRILNGENHWARCFPHVRVMLLNELTGSGRTPEPVSRPCGEPTPPAVG